jgi:hypothetical protein
MNHERGAVYICEMCEALAVHWVRWSTSSGDTHTFCDGDCLSRWIERGLWDTGREIALEHHGRDLDDPAPSDFEDPLL